jgi:starch phosphorylase
MGVTTVLVDPIASERYNQIENVVLPLYHLERERWTWMMGQATVKVACYVNTQCMMRRNAAEA